MLKMSGKFSFRASIIFSHITRLLFLSVKKLIKQKKKKESIKKLIEKKGGDYNLFIFNGTNGLSSFYQIP